MRNKIAKKLKMEVAIAMYVGDGVTEKEVKEDRKSVFASDDFKPVYRARKKNHYRVIEQQATEVTTVPDTELVRMMQVRKEKEAYRKYQLDLRKIKKSNSIRSSKK